MKDFYEKQLIERFEKRQTFSRSDLYDFYLEYEPDLKEGTFGWRIYDLKKKDIIKNVGKGIYALCDKPEYKPNLSERAKKTAKLLVKKFSGFDYCVSETSWLNEFSVQQTGSSVVILETEKDLVNSAFFTLKDDIKDLYLQPGENEMELYVLEKEKPVVLKSIISRSPLQKIKDKNQTINVPRLEKILTDVYCDRHIYYFYSGVELENIFENALRRYAIDFSRLFNYAERRGKETEIKEFITQKINRSIGNILK